MGLDVTDAKSVRAAADELANDPGRFDVLVNNAAAYVDWSEMGSTAEIDASKAAMETNRYGGWRMAQALLPLLRRSPAPHIVNVSSGAGSHEDASFGLTARGGAAASYGISKAALNDLTSTLATELAQTNVLVNAICPGLTATWPGAENMGARSVEVSATGVVWAATLPTTVLPAASSATGHRCPGSPYRHPTKTKVGPNVDFLPMRTTPSAS